jgi:hypothetical protein
MKKLLLLLFFPIFVHAQGNLEESPTPNYPKVEQGENVQKTHDDWIKAKKDWIQNHPEEYRAMGGDPEAVLAKDQQKEEAAQKPKFEAIPFDVERSFVLQNISIVPDTDYVPKNGEVQEQLNTIQEDYKIGATLLQFDANQGIRLTDHEAMNIVGQEQRHEDKQVEWFFDNKECPSCAKTIVLTLEQESSDRLVYLMRSEDEQHPFACRLTFVAQ